MKQATKITAIISGTVLIIVLIAYSFLMQLAPTNTINTQGLATISVMPDLVTINYNIETRADTASEATQKNAEILQNLEDNLEKEGFKQDKITTSNFNVREEYEWNSGNRKFKGFIASHQLKLEIPISESSNEKIGDAVDAGSEAEALISYINFELTPEKQEEHKAEAIKQATQDARVKAESIAEGLGAKLGNIVSVHSSDFNYHPWIAYESVSGDSVKSETIGTEIQPGEKDITARITATYKIA